MPDENEMFQPPMPARQKRTAKDRSVIAATVFVVLAGGATFVNLMTQPLPKTKESNPVKRVIDQMTPAARERLASEFAAGPSELEDAAAKGLPKEEQAKIVSKVKANALAQFKNAAEEPVTHLSGVNDSHGSASNVESEQNNSGRVPPPPVDESPSAWEQGHEPPDPTNNAAEGNPKYWDAQLTEKQCLATAHAMGSMSVVDRECDNPEAHQAVWDFLGAKRGCVTLIGYSRWLNEIVEGTAEITKEFDRLGQAGHPEACAVSARITAETAATLAKH